MKWREYIELQERKAIEHGEDEQSIKQIKQASNFFMRLYNCSLEDEVPEELLF